MARDTYNTRQKILIRKLLAENSHTPLSCDGIVGLLKDAGTPVGKATVYRFLESLAEKGEVRKYFDSENKISTFQFVDKDMNCSEHMHLKCVSCGKLIHLGCGFMSDVDEHILKHHNFRVDNSKTVILGRCESCEE